MARLEFRHPSAGWPASCASMNAVVSFARLLSGPFELSSTKAEREPVGDPLRAVRLRSRGS